MKEVYTLTMVCLKLRNKSGEETTDNIIKIDTRLIGIDIDQSSLIEAILYNQGDLFECYYNYGVIEKVELCPHTYMRRAEVIQWFKGIWSKDHPNEPKEIVKCDPPEWAKNIVNWWGNGTT
jgi:hypothetical protein